jgi:hypothetical protein
MRQVTTWLYHATDGREIWLPHDPTFPCIYCQEPVGDMSMGGPAVCGSCDCGNHRDGRKWTAQEAFQQMYPMARKRLDAIADAGTHATPTLLTN